MDYSQYSPRNGNSLLLTSRQLTPLPAHLGLVACRKGGDKAVDVCLLGRIDYFFHAHRSLIVTVLDVLSNGTVKEDRLLADDS